MTLKYSRRDWFVCWGMDRLLSLASPALREPLKQTLKQAVIELVTTPKAPAPELNPDFFTPPALVSAPDINVKPGPMRGSTREDWDATECTCGNGDSLGHFLGCAKWQMVMNSAAKRARES